jgi:hypothetical protein
MEEGAFDDLPGEGQPLDLGEAPFEDPDMRLAHHLLRSSGFTLPWIAERREIEADFAGACKSLARAWHWCQSAEAGDWADAEWRRAVEAFQKQVSRLNQRITDYNLIAPTPAAQRPLLEVEYEIGRITESSDG